MTLWNFSSHLVSPVFTGSSFLYHTKCCRFLFLNIFLIYSILFTHTTIVVIQKYHHLYPNSLARLILQLLGTYLPACSIWHLGTRTIFLKYKSDHTSKRLGILQWQPMIYVTLSKPLTDLASETLEQLRLLPLPHILYHPWYVPIPSHLESPDHTMLFSVPLTFSSG